MESTILAAYRTEFARYRGLAEKALRQVEDARFFTPIDASSNSVAVLVKHLGGNLRSRFTDFLTTDGEKPWRERDAEFEIQDEDRASLVEGWDAGWAALESALQNLSENQLRQSVTIRGQPLTIADALTRSVAHVAMHVGQIVLLAKHFAGESWETLSIPKGGTAAYNANPTKEKSP